MENEVLIYDTFWYEIKKRDWPEEGMVYICKDVQRRLMPECWTVSIMGDRTLEGDTVQLGLFWKKENAVIFAERYVALTPKLSPLP
jgi:hypothetical protein